MKFNNFDHAFEDGQLTITPQTNIAAGDGISVSGSTVTNAAPMCDIAVYGLAAETIISGSDITAIKWPFEMPYNWFPTRGVLEMQIPPLITPILIGVEEYSVYDKLKFHNTTVSLTTESGIDILNIYPRSPARREGRYNNLEFLDLQHPQLRRVRGERI